MVIIVCEWMAEFISHKIKLLDIIEYLIEKSQKTSIIKFSKNSLGSRNKTPNTNSIMNLNYKTKAKNYSGLVNIMNNNIDNSKIIMNMSKKKDLKNNENSTNLNKKTITYGKNNKYNNLNSNIVQPLCDFNFIFELKNNTCYYYFCPIYCLRSQKDKYLNKLYKNLSEYLSVETLFDIYCYFQNIKKEINIRNKKIVINNG